MATIRSTLPSDGARFPGGGDTAMTVLAGDSASTRITPRVLNPAAARRSVATWSGCPITAGTAGRSRSLTPTKMPSMVAATLRAATAPRAVAADRAGCRRALWPNCVAGARRNQRRRVLKDLAPESLAATSAVPATRPPTTGRARLPSTNRLNSSQSAGLSRTGVQLRCLRVHKPVPALLP